MDLLRPLLTAFFSILAATLAAGLIGLPLLRRINVGQQVRDDGPQSHLKKSGTPTFGGLFFLIPLIGASIYNGLTDPASRVLLALGFLILGFALVGFIDDYIKVRITKKGLSVQQKSLIMFAVSVAFTVYYLYLAPQQPFFLVPFLSGNPSVGSAVPIVITGFWKFLYGIFVVLYLFFVTNAVNITDGVDGLAASVTTISATGLCAGAVLLAASLTNRYAAVKDSGSGAAYLAGIENSRSAAILAAAVAGGCIGFLFFNRHPAKIFMGDTGSQALGAALAGIALIIGAPWLILFVGVIYIIEAFSVMIQVAYFRRTGGKRLFRMSPIHHHFELGGWSEEKIVFVFSLITLIGSALGVLIVRL